MVKYHFPFLLLLLWPLTNTMAYSDDEQNFPLTAREWGINGPVKTFKDKNPQRSRDLLELTFTEKGNLTYGAVYKHKKLVNDRSVHYDERGNVLQNVTHRYTMECPDCKQYIRKTDSLKQVWRKKKIKVMEEEADEEGYLYNKCKRNEQFVKEYVHTFEKNDYDDKGLLLMHTEINAGSNYFPHIVRFTYDNDGNMIAKTAVSEDLVDLPNSSSNCRWRYEDGLLRESCYDTYIYNENKQLIEKICKNSEGKIKTTYAYHPNGKLRQVIDCRSVAGDNTDTTIFNSNGDTLSSTNIWNSFYCNDIVRSEKSNKKGIRIRYSKLLVCYNKKNVKTGFQLLNNGKTVYEEKYDKKGRIVRKEFPDGYTEYEYMKKSFVKKVYYNGTLYAVTKYNRKGLPVQIDNYENQFYESIFIVYDAYDNVITQTSKDAEGNVKKVLTYEYSYY